MAKVGRLIPTTSIQDYMDFFESFDCPLFNVSSNSIYIDNGEVMITVTEDSDYTNGRDWIISYAHGSSYTLVQQGPAAIWLCCSDNFFWLTVESNDTNKILFLYERILIDEYDDYWKYLTGHAYTAKSGNPDIHNVTITDVEYGDEYTHGKLFNYTCENVYPDCYDYIDYSEDTLFVSNGLSNLVDPNTYTCSTVPINKIVTFSGINYFALGTNTVIPIDTPT